MTDARLSPDLGSRDEGPEAVRGMHGNQVRPGAGGACGNAHGRGAVCPAGSGLTLQPTPTLDLQTQPGLRSDEVTLWEPGSVSVTCEHSPPEGGHRTRKAARQRPAGRGDVLLACCCVLILVGGALRNRAGVRLSGEWWSGSGKGGLQTLAALKPGEEVSSQQCRGFEIRVWL